MPSNFAFAHSFLFCRAHTASFDAANQTMFIDVPCAYNRPLQRLEVSLTPTKVPSTMLSYRTNSTHEGCVRKFWSVRLQAPSDIDNPVVAALIYNSTRDAHIWILCTVSAVAGA